MKPFRYRIYYLDDEQVNTHLFEQRFRGQYDIEVFNRVGEFLQAVCQHTPDLVVLDLMMPDITGFDVLNLLRSTRRSRFLPVLILTAMEKSESLAACFEQGADDFMLKPPDFTELGIRMESLILRHYRNREQVRQRRIDSMRRMISGFNHEFNNHLTILQSDVEMLGIGVTEPKQKERIERLLETVRRSANLLKVLTRLYSWKSESSRSCRLSDLMPRLKSMLEKQIQDSGIVLEWEDSTQKDLELVVSSEAMETVLDILMKNATESFFEQEKKDRKIRFEAQNSDQMLQIRVEDNGCGISQELLPKVFDLFFTTKGSLGGSLGTSKLTETGIGLSLAEVILGDCGGRIDLDSREGLGTVAGIMVPLGHPVHAGPEWQPQVRPHQGPIQVALVTDPGTDSMLLKEWMLLQGITCTEISPAVPSPRIPAESDVLLICHKGERAFGFVEKVREKWGRLPIIWLCEEHEKAEFETSLRVHDVQPIFRPLNYEELTDALDRLRWSPVFSRF